jgi:hypothetical protein
MKNQTQLPAQLDEQVKNSGLELSEAQSLAANYAPFFEVVAAKEAELKALEKGNAAHVASAKRIRVDLGRTCSALESVKKDHKAALLVRTRYIDGLFNAANGYARLTQETAKDIEDHFERIEAERKEKLREARAAKLVPFEGMEPTLISEMSDTEWANYLVGVEAGFNARIAAEAKAKAEAEAAAEAERQRIAEQAAENTRLKAEAEARGKQMAEERAKAEAERKAAQDAADKARLEAEAKAAKERAELEAKIRAEAEAKAKVEAELEAKRQAEARAEVERIAAEQKAEAERIKAAKAPIKVKLNAWVDSFTLPSTDVDNATAHVITEKFNAFKAWAKTQVENE